MMRSTVSRSLFLATLSLGASLRPAHAQSLTNVRVAVNPIDAYLSPFIGIELGLFSKAGLSVEIMRATSGAQTITAVVGGAMDIGIATPVSTVSAYLAGVPLQYFAAGPLFDGAVPSAAMCVTKDSPIKAARDFTGKTIGVVALRDGTQLAAAAYLTQNGVDPAQVNFVELTFPAMAESLARGRVDAAMCAEPFMPSPGNGMRVFVNPYQAIGRRFLSAGYFGAAAWIKENPTVARRFANVIYEAAKWGNNPANLAARNAILVKYGRIDEAVAQRIVHVVYAESLDAPLLQPWLDWAYRLKYIDKPVRATELIAKV